MLTMFDLHGKTALITGSNRGIGRSILLAYALYGADVILHCRKPNERADQVIRQAEANGVRCYAVYADLSERDGPDRLYDGIKELGLNVDILVLGASIEIRNEWTKITDEEFDLQLNTNLRSPMKLMQKFIPDMQARRWGRVITMGSVQQVKPIPPMLVYSALKAAQYNMVLSLAPQIAPDGVTINNLAPGAIRTDRNAEALSDPAYEAHVQSLIPVRYIGQPDDIAAIAVYLASEESKYMTGENIIIAGGKDL